MEEIGAVQLVLGEELHNLSCIQSEETLHNLLCSLWTTRKTGLHSPAKSRFQSLLNLSSPSQLLPVLACLRSLIRKCVYQDLTGDELLKVFPPDLPLELQRNLLLCLERNRSRWKEEMLREEQVKRPGDTTPLHFPPPWPRHHDDVADSATRAPTVVPSPEMPPCFQCDNVAPSENLPLEDLPCLKSMNWIMESRGPSSDRVAVISLKLDEFNKSSLGEKEVKFQLTMDTFDAMLRSMTYISEQLSAVGTSSKQANKKQKQ